MAETAPDRALGRTGVRPPPLAAVAAAIGWVASSVWMLALGVGAGETCSSEVGSVQAQGTTELLVPCNLVGWVVAMSQIGGLVVIVVATASGAWRHRFQTIVTFTALVVLPAVCFAALSAANLT